METMERIVGDATRRFEEIGYQRGQIAVALALGSLVKLWLIRGDIQCADELRTFLNRIADETSRDSCPL